MKVKELMAILASTDPEMEVVHNSNIPIITAKEANFVLPSRQETIIVRSLWLLDQEDEDQDDLDHSDDGCY